LAVACQFHRSGFLHSEGFLLEDKIMNVTELREQLVDVFNKLRAKEIGVSEAKELANVAGKIVSSAKTQLEYNRYCGSKNSIKFLEGK